MGAIFSRNLAHNLGTTQTPHTTLLSSATDYQETEEDKWEKLNQGHVEMLVGISNNNQL